MSLEQKIDALTTAVENLTAQMASANITTAQIDKVVDKVVTEVIEEASTADKATAAKINAETKKKALAETKARKAKDAEATKIAADKAQQSDDEVGNKPVSADELKAACLTAARAKPENKVKVKALLKEFDATVVKDVAEGDRPVVLARLEAGEF